jgi:hypothetical protein
MTGDFPRAIPMQSASRLSEPQRSAEREALAKAIERFSVLDSQLERLTEARSRLDLRGRENALAATRGALDETRQRAPEILIAKMMGESYDPAATVEHAQQLLDAAQRDLDEALAADRLLADEIKVVEDRRDVAQIARARAVDEVVKSSAEVRTFCARVEQTRQQLHDFSWTCSAIGLGRLPPGFHWDGTRWGLNNGAGTPWQTAIAALKENPDIELPSE